MLIKTKNGIVGNCMPNTKRVSPVIKPVLENFQTVYYQTYNFAKNGEQSAINGLLVMGDAGTGKSHWVKQALRDAGVQQNVEYIKGGVITAASAYVKLYLNRHPHRITVFDDIDLLGSSEIRNKIVPMLLGALEEGNNRQVTWSTAKKNPLMEEFDVPFDFRFNGNVIIITNYVRQDIFDKLKAFRNAFESRFNDVECVFTHEQKYLYTKYLIEEHDMLSANCKVHYHITDNQKKPGYPADVIDSTLDFIDDNYLKFSDITPRVAIKIADTFMHYEGQNQRVMLNNLVK